VNVQKECSLPNDVHEVDTNEREKKCKIREERGRGKREEERKRRQIAITITREMFSAFCLVWGIVLRMQMQPDARGLMQLGDVATMSKAARARRLTRCWAGSGSRAPSRSESKFIPVHTISRPRRRSPADFIIYHLLYSTYSTLPTLLCSALG
jgi:hypothetical protein